MPATYAHFRFGREVLRRLSPETREAIAPRIQLYHIGLHGPDIFFYYHPLSKNPVQALGGQLHLLSGREILTRMEAVRDRYPADSRRGLDAYIFGFICHYALTRPPTAPSTKASKRPAPPTRRSSRTSTGRCS